MVRFWSEFFGIDVVGVGENKLLRFIGVGSCVLKCLLFKCELSCCLWLVFLNLVE